MRERFYALTSLVKELREKENVAFWRMKAPLNMQLMEWIRSGFMLVNEGQKRNLKEMVRKGMNGFQESWLSGAAVIERL